MYPEPQRRTRRSRRSAATVALGCCLLAASTSTKGVNAFGRTAGGGTTSWAPAMVASPAARIGISANPNRRISRSNIYPVGSYMAVKALHYQEGRGDVDAAAASDAAVAQAAGETDPTRSSSPYVRDAEERLTKRAQRKRTSGWWDAIIWRRRKVTTRNGHTLKEQFVLDDYLDFVDKRYNRMHEEEKQARRSKKKQAATSKAGGKSRNEGMSATWAWLMNGQEDDCDLECQGAALEVLGLAELASGKLLRKKHMPVPMEDVGPRSRIVIDASAQTVVPCESMGRRDKLTSSSKTVAGILASVASLRVLYDQRVGTAMLAVKSFWQSVLPYAKTALNPRLSLPALLDAAGGRKAFETTASLALAFLVVIAKPLAQVTGLARSG